LSFKNRDKLFIIYILLAIIKIGGGDYSGESESPGKGGCNFVIPLTRKK